MKGGHKNFAWTKLERDKAWGKQGCRCAYCLTKMRRDEATADHVNPKARGGTDTGNIVAACAFCNKAKGKIPPRKFKRMISGGMPSLNCYIETVRIIRRLNRQTESACKRILASVGKTA